MSYQPPYGGGAAPYGAAPYGAAPYGAAPQNYCYQPGFSPVNPAAYALFLGVDANRSGTVDARELHAALSNGGWTAFSFKTTKILMRMFDADRSGALAYREFESLLAQLMAWRQWFDAADADRSGKLSPPELSRCLRAFGFALPEPTMFEIFKAVDLDSSGSIGFDEFIQVLAEVNSLTAAFRRYDPASSGRATLEWGTFMHLVYSTRS